MFSKKIIGMICLTLSMWAIAFSQEGKSRPTKRISVCRLELKNKVANFQFAFSYYLDVADTGEVLKVTELSNVQREKKFKFVRDELFVECLKKWRLEPAGRYFVTFYVGTTRERDYMRIVGPDKEVLEVDLAKCEDNELKVDESQKRE